MHDEIQISANGTTPAQLERLLSETLRETPGVSFSTPAAEKHSLAMDSSSLSLMVDLTKALLPNVIAAIALIWAAKITAGNKKEYHLRPRHAKLVIYRDGGVKQVHLDHPAVASELSEALKAGNAKRLHFTWDQDE
jgi:hypothetical protein